MPIVTTRTLNDILEDIKFSVQTIEDMDETIQRLERILINVKGAINLTSTEIKDGEVRTGKYNVVITQSLIDSINGIEFYDLPSTYAAREIRM